MTKQNSQAGLAPIVILVVALFVVGGAAAVVSYVQNNQSEIEGIVEESQQQTQDQMTQDYPSLYVQAGLPQYPNATVIKKREGRNLADGVQVTLETTDSIAAVKTFFDQALQPLGLQAPNALTNNEFASFSLYTQGNKRFSLQITKIEDTGNNQIQINYSE